jgi:hypothetical protein
MGLKAIVRTILTRYTPPLMWKPILKYYYFYRIKSYSREINLENRARELYVIKNLIKRGDTVIDIGSNLGFILYSYQGPSGKVDVFIASNQSH